MRRQLAILELILSAAVMSTCGSSAGSPTATAPPTLVPGEYRGHVYQANTVIYPDVSFVLSADGKSITGLKTSAPPGAAMYPDCGGGGYSIAGNQYGFPSPRIGIHKDGTFAGDATSGHDTTAITGHFADDNLLAIGTIHLVGPPIPGQSSCPVNATFRAAKIEICADAPSGDDAVTRWTSVVRCALPLLHRPTTDTNVNAALALIRLESGGLATAIGFGGGNNPTSFGLTQLTETTFMEFANPALSSNILDPLANIYAALNWALNNHLDISKVGGGFSVEPQQHNYSTLATCADAPGSGDEVARWSPVVKCALALLNQSPSDTNVNAVLALVRKESGGDPNATNNFDTTSHAGLTQITESTFEQYADPVLSASPFDPLQNIYAAVHFTLANGRTIANLASTF